MFALVSLIAVALISLHHVFSSSPDSGDLTELPKDRELSPLGKLFSQYQSDPTLHTSEGEIELGGGDHFWSDRRIPTFQRKLIKNYLKRIDVSNLQDLIQSFKVCKENNAERQWKVFSPVMTTTLHHIASELDLLAISPSDKITLKEMIESSCGRNAYAYDCQDFQGMLLGSATSKPLYPGSDITFEHKIVAGILGNKSCLLAIVVSLYKRAENPVLFVNAMLPFLDNQTRSRFLRYVETALSIFGVPCDVSHLRHWKCLEERDAFNFSENVCSIRHSLLTEFPWLRIQRSEIQPIDLATGNASKIPLSRSRFGYLVDSVTALLQSARSTDAWFECDDLVSEVLAGADLNTLLHSVPCVNRRFNKIATKNFIFQRSQDLRDRLNAQAPMFDPYYLSVMYPWNTIFSSTRQLVKFHLLENMETTDKRWLTAALETMTDLGTENDFDLEMELKYGNEEMLKHCLMHVDWSELFRHKDFPISTLMRLLDIILQDKASFPYSPFALKFEKLLFLVMHVKEGARLLQVISIYMMQRIINVIVFLDELHMLKEVLNVAEEYVYEKYNLKVSLSLSAEQILDIDPIVLLKMITVAEFDPRVLIEVFSATMNRSWRGSNLVTKMIHHLLVKNPMAMSPNQFEALVHFADHELRADWLNFLKSAVQRQSATQIKKSKTAEQN